MSKKIIGFSKLSKSDKINWVIDTYLPKNENAKSIITQYWNTDEKLQNLHDEFKHVKKLDRYPFPYFQCRDCS